jgi:hypothetical protein
LAATCVVSHAQNDAALPLLGSEPATPQSSYEARILKRQGVRDVDPNVYVYTPAFAKRFQMPLEWASDELKGAEAVAFRVVPSYKTCGWGGDPKACQEDAVRCDMDVYFDHKLNPLAWDERMRSPDLDRSTSSLAFIGNIANPFARPKGTLIDSYRSPFTDPTSGKELGWRGGFYRAKDEYGGSFVGLRAYDREMFKGMSMLTLGVACPADSVPQALWLSNDHLTYLERAQAFTQIELPESWQERVKRTLIDADQRSKAFFKEQGLKALKALQAQPVPSKPATPIQ